MASAPVPPAQQVETDNVPEPRAVNAIAISFAMGLLPAVAMHRCGLEAALAEASPDLLIYSLQLALVRVKVKFPVRNAVCESLWQQHTAFLTAN